MRISDWSSDVCSSDLILGAGGDGRNGLLAGLIDAAGELAVDGVRPARGGDLVTGAGIARCFTGPVSEVVAVTQRNRHQQGEAGERAVPPPVPPAPAQFMCAAIGGIGGKRTEEHTSELQSLMRISYAVFCLKKKKQTSLRQQSQHIDRKH